MEIYERKGIYTAIGKAVATVNVSLQVYLL